MSKAVIPNLPPISSIKDPDVRVALESMWNAWRVRNGDVGDGEHKFLTAADLKDAVNSQQAARGNGGNLGSGASGTGSGSWVGPLIASIQDDIMQSRLWKILGERIEWIDTPEWFVNKFDRSFGTAIKNEQLIRESADSSLASSISTVSAVLNGNIAVVQQTLTANVTLTEATASSLTLLKSEFDDAVAGFQQEITTVANSVSALSESTTQYITQINDNIGLIQLDVQSVTDVAGTHTSQITTLQNSVAGVEVSAQEAFDLATTVEGKVTGSWTVKFDANGYVTGAGLGLEGKNGSYSSSFLVRADKFAVGSPEHPSITPTVPFVVYTTPTNIAGRVVPPGAYMDSAFITRLTADQIDTRGLSIKDLNGNIILASGTALDWSNIGGTGKPVDGATKNIITYASTAPASPANGDIWVDTSVTPNLAKVRVGGIWRVGGNYTTDTNQLTDGAGLGDTAVWSGVSGTGKPADGATKNNIYRQAAAPTSGMSINDIWFNTGTQATYYYSGAAWVLAGDKTSSNTAAGISNQGAFATLNKILAGNISTYIADLAVDTLQIAGNAITLPITDTRYNTLTGNNEYQEAAAVSFETAYQISCLIIYNGQSAYPNGTWAGQELHIKYQTWTGGAWSEPKVELAGRGGNAINDYPTIAWSGLFAPGAYRISVDWWGSNGNIQHAQRTLSVVGSKK